MKNYKRSKTEISKIRKDNKDEVIFLLQTDGELSTIDINEEYADDIVNNFNYILMLDEDIIKIKNELINEEYDEHIIQKYIDENFVKLNEETELGKLFKNYSFNKKHVSTFRQSVISGQGNKISNYISYIPKKFDADVKKINKEYSKHQYETTRKLNNLRLHYNKSLQEIENKYNDEIKKIIKKSGKELSDKKLI